MAALAAVHVSPLSLVQRSGMATSPMFSLLPATPENTAPVKEQPRSFRAAADAWPALAGPIPVMASTTSVPLRRPK